MVDEITDFEVLEIAVRELAIEKGLFTADDHRKFTEWAESDRAGGRLAAGRQGVDRPGVQGARTEPMPSPPAAKSASTGPSPPAPARRATTCNCACSKIRRPCIT